jgi:NADP-reducing hydrogenase subunit HndD
VRDTVDIRALRAKVLYDMDNSDTIRKSHENPCIKAVYDEYLGQPGGEKAHHLLHTSYVKREINNYTSD